MNTSASKQALINKGPCFALAHADMLLREIKNYHDL